MERQLYLALQRLERPQAARSGAALTAPLVLEVGVTSMPEEAGAEMRDPQGRQPCIGEITEQSQSTDCSIFPRC